ncbi:DNA polymerase III subunit epsilon [Stenoxybacter acetivorans]|uniref:DNA polymerase III subunit epsilon n=1 Tax=Stenoxybacter acetivorans TaxID=422441 RepID=UPI00068E28D2|nr:DNA polymerase III subunit epsilon [Stenoxybacter acetivorans]
MILASVYFIYRFTVIMRQIILDTETTGLRAAGGDRLIEFAGLEMIDRRLTGNSLHLYIHPERDIEEEAIAIHGISLDFLAEKKAPVFAEAGKQIADFIKDAELIIHNAPFDVGFLNMEFARMGLPATETIAGGIIDTLKMAKTRYPGQKNSLDALCTRLSIDRSRRIFHGALIDCELLSEVYLALTRSQFSLVDGLAENNQTQTATLHNRQPLPHPLIIQAAGDAELHQHEAYLNALGEPCLWRQSANRKEADA